MTPKWECRASCKGCGTTVYMVTALPESARDEVDRLLRWIRSNTKIEHRDRYPDCKGFRLVVRWLPWQAAAGGAKALP